MCLHGPTPLETYLAQKLETNIIAGMAPRGNGPSWHGAT